MHNSNIVKSEKYYSTISFIKYYVSTKTLTQWYPGMKKKVRLNYTKKWNYMHAS